MDNMIVLIIFLMCIFITLLVGGAAALSDFRTMTIPNMYSVYVMAAFAVAYAGVWLSGLDGVFAPLLSHVISAVVTFLVTFVLFGLKVIGAGDSKFATACAFWIGAKFLPIYLFYMTLCGGLLGAVALYIKKKKPFENPMEGSWIAQVQGGKDKVPYGIAISFGMVIAFLYAGYFSADVLSIFVAAQGAGASS